MTKRNRSAQTRLGLATQNVTGQNIRRLRKALLGNLSDREFCEYFFSRTHMKLPKETLSRIETGKRVVYDYEVVRFADVIGVTIEEVFAVDETLAVYP